MKREAFCPSCEEYRQTKVVDRKERYTVRGREIEVPVRAEVCTACGETLGSDEQDQQVLDALHAEYRRQTDLLTPERIKEIRQRYRLSQKSFAALLGMSEATINRYERGALQDPAHDTAIRACAKPEVLRDLLERRGHSLSEWQRKRAEEALAGQAAKPESEVLDLLGEIDWICMPKEITERTGFRRFDYKRFASVVTWFCRELGQVSRTVINKLMFYADFLNFKTATVSLTGTAYRRVRLGPVPADYDGLLSRMESEGVLVREQRDFPGGYVGHYYHPGPNAGVICVEFTPHEEEVLEHVARTLGRMTAKTLSVKSHEEAAWQDTEDGQFISYQHARSLSLSLRG
jgi:putative zinc finger/helix-turn-helix YgiT family protein